MENNMKKPYPYIPKTLRTETAFSKKWGILASDLAKEEGTSIAAIHMRVMNYGTPFQRKKLPTLCEVMTGKTAIELAQEINITPITIYERIKKYGDPHHEADLPGPIAQRGIQRAEKHWTETKMGGTKVGCKDGWLSPRHPDYHTWRFKYIQQHCPTAHDPVTKENTQ
jgi:hypothetical protein